jgi:hypothetical protein
MLRVWVGYPARVLHRWESGVMHLRRMPLIQGEPCARRSSSGLRVWAAGKRSCSVVSVFS